MKEKIKNITNKFDNTKVKFNELSNSKKMAIVSGTACIILACVFAFSFIQKNKYAVLFSDLETQDAANITSELEKRKVSMKIEGNTVYVDKSQVDKLRLELAPGVTDGSKGFELMDETSSVGLTEEEFQIKKQRMIQGEIEKTIKSFPQVENARVHISQGSNSVFEKEAEPGRAAVYLILKNNASLSDDQVKSIIALVAGSTQNIPKENIDVIDGNMNLLSEGLIESDNESNENTSPIKLEESKNAESELNKKLESSILKMLEPIFGQGKVKATVNTNLNFDSIVTTDLTIKPDKVAIKEVRSKSSSKNSTPEGNGATDSNMNNNNNSTSESSDESMDESFEYAVGKTEVQTISTPGEVERITASVAIDGQVARNIRSDVEDIVMNSIGMDTQRGDSISVISMAFDPSGKAQLEEELELMKKEESKAKLNKAIQVWAVLVIILIVAYVIYRKTKDKQFNNMVNSMNNSKKNSPKTDNEVDDSDNKQPKKKKRNYILGDSDEMTLEEEVKLYASEKPDQVTEIIKTWLSE